MIDTTASPNEILWDGLNRWHRVIQHFLRRGRAPRGMTNEAYAKLHRDLLCHVDSLPAGELTRLDHANQSLRRSLRPWVHLDSLAQCDKRILRMLEQEVRVIRDELMPRQRWRAQVLNRIAAVLIVLAIAATSIGIFSSGDQRALGVVACLGEAWQYIEGIRAQLWLGIAQSSTNQRLIILAGSMLVVGTFFLRDTKRS